MDDLVRRLGFDSFAHNVAVNLVEDFVSGDKGSASMESDDVRANVWWDEKTVNFVVTAYAEGKWQTYENNIRRR